MAKLIKTIEINLGDIVYFKPLGSKGEILSGRVQDISEFPDIYVETGNPKKDYKRYRISLNMVEENLSNRDWKVDCYEFEHQEPLEFVYNEDLETTQIISKYNEKRGKVTVHKRENLRSSKKNGND